MRSIIGIVAILLLGVPAAHAADRTIYLTFDDGPLTGTRNILDVLEAEKVPAAMFMVGMHAEASAGQWALVQRAKTLPLVTVGNHSYSHAHGKYRDYYSNTEGVVADMLLANKVLELATPTHARLPGRNVFRLLNISKDDNSLGPLEADREQVDYEFVSASGFLLYGWDFEWVHENSGKPVQTVDHLVSEIDHLFASRTRFMKPGKLILLMHDQMFQDGFNGKANLTALIAALRLRGYAFGDIRSYDG